MRGSHLFEYAVIRFVPRVEREEFINVGVIVYCAGLQFLRAKFMIDKERMETLFPKINADQLEENLLAFCVICKGGKGSGTIGNLTLPERFRWLTATRSTTIQTSKVHPGFCMDAEVMLDRLYDELVL